MNARPCSLISVRVLRVIVAPYPAACRIENVEILRRLTLSFNLFSHPAGGASMSAFGDRVVLLDNDPDYDPREAQLEFRLTYSDKLYATGRKSKGPQMLNHKQEIRRVFHPQLRELWNTSAHLIDDPFRSVILERFPI
jgi:hypothetical protein